MVRKAETWICPRGCGTTFTAYGKTKSAGHPCPKTMKWEQLRREQSK